MVKGKKKWVIWTVVIVIVTNLITLYSSSMYSTYLPNGKVIVSRADYETLGSTKELIKKYGDLNQVFQKYNGVLKYEKLFDIRNKLYQLYDGKIDESAMVDGAIKGMTSALNDPYTEYMDSKEYKEFSQQTEGTYSGVGLQVSADNDKIVVIAPIDGTPAKKAGILPGDIIEKVDGKDVSGKNLEYAVNIMKGKEGTYVTLTMYRASKGSFDVKLMRANITLNTVTGEMLDKNIGYIQISMFDENTGKNFNNELKTLKGKGMKALVLDLRGNPGGLLDQCIEVTSNFVGKNKVIVSTIDKYNKQTKYDSKGGNAIGMPLVVLVDKGTASASEIFSGAIRDYKLGTLIGKKTFGKGVVQTIIENKTDNTALKVTISKYYTPNGENIQKKGIEPDISIDYPESLSTKPYSRSTDPQFQKALEVIKNKLK